MTNRRHYQLVVQVTRGLTNPNSPNSIRLLQKKWERG